MKKKKSKKLKNGAWVVSFLILLGSQGGKKSTQIGTVKIKEELRYDYGIIFAYNGKFATVNNRMAVMN